MKVNFDVKRKFIVNGKEYSSVEEMSPELRAAYDKAVRSGAGSRIEKPRVTVEAKIVSNGKEYGSLEVAACRRSPGLPIGDVLYVLPPIA